MLKLPCILLAGIATSLYFFPFHTTFLPGANTKMLLAATGLAVWGIDLARGRSSCISKDLFVLSLWGIAVSIIGLVSVAYNETSDYTYATYIVSMWVWLGGAYAVARLIRSTHGRLSLPLVGDYLIGVCAAQCLLALAMDQHPPLKDFIDSFLAGEGFMGKVEHRLYGIGASLDVAGMKFAAVLLLVARFGLDAARARHTGRTVAYILSFFIIAGIGNMMGRTTTVGALPALAYWLYACVTARAEERPGTKLFATCFACILAVVLPAAVYVYHTDAAIHGHLRFAFEGFFSLYEQGRWETHSNNILKGMYVLPDNMKTWLIGDGYFDNPNLSAYYIGPQWRGFYHDTDVGYLRFVYYFGLAGLASFIIYMCKVAGTCMRRFPEHRALLAAILALNLLIWFKVSSDLFPVFALFLCIGQEEHDRTEALHKLG